MIVVSEDNVAQGDALMSYEGGRNMHAAAATAGPPAWAPEGDTAVVAAAVVAVAAVQRFPLLPRKSSDAPRTQRTTAGGGTLMGMSGLVLSPIDDSQCSP